MNKNEMRIAITESLGARYRYTSSISRRFFGTNYPEDLNACMEFEKSLDGEDQRVYLRKLYHVAVEEEADKTGISTDVLCNEDEMFIVATATSEQRCIAYLKTKGLWKPTE